MKPMPGLVPRGMEKGLPAARADLKRIASPEFRKGSGSFSGAGGFFNVDQKLRKDVSIPCRCVPPQRLLFAAPKNEAAAAPGRSFKIRAILSLTKQTSH